MGEDHRRRPGEDRISGLPDEMLHKILVGLNSVRAAARTSVLSHRWRRVWTQIPKLPLFFRDEPPPGLFMDYVDAVLDASSAPAIEFLWITMPISCGSMRIPARRVARWLRFTSQRVVGKFWLDVPELDEEEDEEKEVEIPMCDRAVVIYLKLRTYWLLRLPKAGLFTALKELKIQSATVEGSEITALVSTQCPRLRILSLFVTLCSSSDVSIRSDSLEVLWFYVDNTSRLEIVGPKLERLTVHNVESHVISAPKLAKLDWDGHVYDSHHHQFVNVGRHLRLLKLGRICAVASRFDKVDELKLDISIPQDSLGYERFINETSKLPKCETLSVSLMRNGHGIVPIMIHLLRSCSTTKKFSIALSSGFYTWMYIYSCPLPCQCRMTQNHGIDNIAAGGIEAVEFAEQLSSCNTANLRKIVNLSKVVIYHFGHLTKETCEKDDTLVRALTEAFEPKLKASIHRPMHPEARIRLRLSQLKTIMPWF
ncbi:hypothetical protein EJB05_57602, partial [Eragrostis curvula]